MSEFGIMLKSLRHKRQMTQRQLSELAKIDFTYISKIENGAMEPPSEEAIIRIAAALNEEPEKMILAAKRIPSQFHKDITENKEISMFLRTADKLTQEQWVKIRKIVSAEKKHD